MRYLETEGKTVEEAIEKALSQLGLARNEVMIDVLEEGSRGIFSFGSRLARIRVRPTATTASVKKLIATLLDKMDIEAAVNVEEKEGIFFVDIETGGMDGLLIGKGGRTLVALQHILGRMIGRIDQRARVMVDVGGYRARQHDILRRRARELAERVKQTGREYAMDPLASPERRVVHMALTDDPNVRTYTVGEGDQRRVVVAPALSGNRERNFSSTTEGYFYRNT